MRRSRAPQQASPSSASCTPLAGHASLPLGSRRDSSFVQEVVGRVAPGELWGASSVLIKAAGFSSVSTKAVAAAVADFPPGDSTGPQVGPKDGQARTLRERLDNRPRLSLLDKAATFAIPGAICGALYLALRPATVTLGYAVGLTMIYAAWTLICRAVLLERQYTARLVSERDLADPDSRFGRLDGVDVHYKHAAPAAAGGASPRTAVHCFHGFGANTGSWNAARQPLADGLGALVTDHDMPGFGLTERPADPNKYSLECNGRLGRLVMDRELATSASDASKADQSTLQKSEGAPRIHLVAEGHGSSHPPAARPPEVQRVLVGHSLGGACAAAEVIQNPQGVQSLVLVAPAIMAFGFLRPANAGKVGAVEAAGPGRSCTAQFAPPVGSAPPVESVRRLPRRNAAMRVAVALGLVFRSLIGGLGTRLLRPVTVVSLRAAVRNRAFWERGLARAWFNKAGVTPALVDAYRQPQLVRGWERGLLMFATARMSGGRQLGPALKDAWTGHVKPTQAELLAEAVAAHGIKVLIVHGENDALVPPSNSRRLAALLPNARLVPMPRTGHSPQEERPDEFVAIIRRFLGEQFGDAVPA